MGRTGPTDVGLTQRPTHPAPDPSTRQPTSFLFCPEPKPHSPSFLLAQPTRSLALTHSLTNPLETLTPRVSPSGWRFRRRFRKETLAAPFSPLFFSSPADDAASPPLHLVLFLLRHRALSETSLSLSLSLVLSTRRKHGGRFLAIAVALFFLNSSATNAALPTPPVCSRSGFKAEKKRKSRISPSPFDLSFDYEFG